MLTCKEFLTELSDYLDEHIDIELKRKLEVHLNACPNCWVVCDTTRKTIQVYKGMQAQPIPASIHDRLLCALEKKIQERKQEAEEQQLPRPPAPGIL